MSVVQLVGLNEPSVAVMEIATPDLLSEVEAVIVDDWAVVIVEGLDDNDKKGVGAPRAATWAIAVFHDWKAEEARYSPATQKVELIVGVGSVATPK